MSPPPGEPSRAMAIAECECVSGPERRQAEFGSFYRATLVPLRDYLARLLNDRSEAQDIAHDAFLKTYHVASRQSVEKPRALLFTIARRLAINHRLRRVRRYLPTENTQLDLAACERRGVVAEVIMRQEDRLFDAALAQLPPGCRTVVILRFHEHLSHAEIATRLGISLSTVANHLTRALRLLRQHVPTDPAP